MFAIPASRAYTRHRLPTQHYSFDGADAERYGVNAAILLYHIRQCIAANVARHQCYHDGMWWECSSIHVFHKLFPFLTTHQIRRALTHLIKAGVVVTGRYGETPGDRTLCYAIV